MFLETPGRTMEDLFFFEKDQQLVEARERLARLQETKENLSKVSGIQDDAVLDKLLALDIRPETLATLFAIPLVEVAWADGEMHEREREQLIAYAEKTGGRRKDLSQEILAKWLRERPDPALLEAWEHYVGELSPRLSEAERQSLREEVLSDARKVAEAAGGFLGFGRLSDEEKAMLGRLERAFA